LARAIDNTLATSGEPLNYGFCETAAAAELSIDFSLDNLNTTAVPDGIERDGDKQRSSGNDFLNFKAHKVNLRRKRYDSCASPLSKFLCRVGFKKVQYGCPEKLTEAARGAEKREGGGKKKKVVSKRMFCRFQGLDQAINPNPGYD